MKEQIEVAGSGSWEVNSGWDGYSTVLLLAPLRGGGGVSFGEGGEGGGEAGGREQVGSTK